MDFSGVKVAVTGSRGFLGSHLVTRLHALGAEVQRLGGRVEYMSTFEQVYPGTRYLFHFGSPSSQVLFDRERIGCIQQTLQGFSNAVIICRARGIKLIYASTGLVSAHGQSDYALCKQLCESIALSEQHLESLGVRIFTAYGPGEEHKEGYASVATQFIQALLAGKPPVVFGDGSQARDFIYVSDVVEGVLEMTAGCPHQIIELGSGRTVTISSLLEVISSMMGVQMSPEYVAMPPNMLGFSKSQDVGFYEPRVSLGEGIRRTVDHLKSVTPN